MLQLREPTAREDRWKPILGIEGAMEGRFASLSGTVVSENVHLNFFWPLTLSSPGRRGGANAKARFKEERLLIGVVVW